MSELNQALHLLSFFNNYSKDEQCGIVQFLSGAHPKKIQKNGKLIIGYGAYNVEIEKFDYTLPDTLIYIILEYFAKEEKKLSWQSFDGRETSLDTISHQHVSNIIHFNQIFGFITPTELNLILNDKYGGIILRYKPNINFKEEISYLYNKGLLVKQSNQAYKIVFRGEEIGELISETDIVF